MQDIERPRFGWRVKATIKQEEPCDLNFENPKLSTCILNSKLNDSSETNNIAYFAQNRQTGEEFRSAAPPDCRYRLEPFNWVIDFEHLA